MLMSVDLLFILSWSGHRWQSQNYLLRKRWWAASWTTVVHWFTHPIPPKPSSPQVLYPAIAGDVISVPMPSSMIPSSPSRWERFVCSSSAASGITDIAACTSVCTRQVSSNTWGLSFAASWIFWLQTLLPTLTFLSCAASIARVKPHSNRRNSGLYFAWIAYNPTVWSLNFPMLGNL